MPNGKKIVMEAIEEFELCIPKSVHKIPQNEDGATVENP
jgi:hypothetical protein